MTDKVPESCLLIILGLVIGALFYTTKLAQQESYILQSEVFFIYLLPPIILEAGFFMPNRPFFNNIGTILLFAICNTIFNVLMTGCTLWAFSFTSVYGESNEKFEALSLFVFASLISAVDPVSVLATFVEIQVNDMLYIIVFGESLLNDAVSVVLVLDSVLFMTNFIFIQFICQRYCTDYSKHSLTWEHLISQLLMLFLAHLAF